MSIVTFSQEKLEKKAKELTEKFNEKLGDNKLTSEQEIEVDRLYLEKLNKIKELKKLEISEEERTNKTKELHKEYAKKLQAVLTKDQKESFKNNKEE